MAAQDEDWEAPASTAGRRGLLGFVVVLAAVAAALLVRTPGGGDPALPVEDQGRSSALAELPEHFTARPPIGGWRTLADSPLTGRTGHTAVWTGEEMIVWGGTDGAGAELADGAAYDPLRDRWRPLAAPPLPPGVDWPLPAVWAGAGASRPAPQEVVVWATARIGGDVQEVGLAYDPQADRWRRLPRAPLAPRRGHALAWTGREVVVWGGVDPATGAAFADGAAYDPLRDRWRPAARAPLTGRRDAAAAGSGEGAILWGGGRADDAGWALADGALYLATADRWSLLPALPARATVGTGRSPPRLAWLDGAAVLDGTLTDATGERVVGVFDARAWRWRLVPRPLEVRERPALVAGGAGAVFFWGGTPRPGRPVVDGAVFHPATGGWRPLREGPPALDGQAAVWTGAELLVWGGADASGGVTDGGAAFDLAGHEAVTGSGR